MGDVSEDAATVTMLLQRLRGNSRISPAQVAVLWASELGVGLRSLAEAEALFAVERGTADTCRAWGDFFVETLLDFLIWDESPSGHLTEMRADWLCREVGDRPTAACMALLVAIVDDASSVPDWFPDAVTARARAMFGPRNEVGRVLAA